MTTSGWPQGPALLPQLFVLLTVQCALGLIDPSMHRMSFAADESALFVFPSMQMGGGAHAQHVTTPKPEVEVNYHGEPAMLVDQKADESTQTEKPKILSIHRTTDRSKLRPPRLKGGQKSSSSTTVKPRPTTSWNPDNFDNPNKSRKPRRNPDRSRTASPSTNGHTFRDAPFRTSSPKPHIKSLGVTPNPDPMLQQPAVSTPVSVSLKDSNDYKAWLDAKTEYVNSANALNEVTTEEAVKKSTDGPGLKKSPSIQSWLHQAAEGLPPGINILEIPHEIHAVPKGAEKQNEKIVKNTTPFPNFPPLDQKPASEKKQPTLPQRKKAPAGHPKYRNLTVRPKSVTQAIFEVNQRKRVPDEGFVVDLNSGSPYAQLPQNVQPQSTTVRPMGESPYAQGNYPRPTPAKEDPNQRPREPKTSSPFENLPQLPEVNPVSTTVRPRGQYPEHTIGAEDDVKKPSPFDTRPIFGAQYVKSVPREPQSGYQVEHREQQLPQRKPPPPSHVVQPQSPFSDPFAHVGDRPAGQGSYPYAGSGLHHNPTTERTTNRPTTVVTQPPIQHERQPQANHPQVVYHNRPAPPQQPATEEPPVAIVTPVTLTSLNSGNDINHEQDPNLPGNARLPRDYATKQVLDSKDAISIHTHAVTAHPSKHGGATSFQSITITHNKTPGHNGAYKQPHHSSPKQSYLPPVISLHTTALPPHLKNDDSVVLQLPKIKPTDIPNGYELIPIDQLTPEYEVVPWNEARKVLNVTVSSLGEPKHKKANHGGYETPTPAHGEPQSGYGAPVAPDTSYGAPQAPVIGDYGAPPKVPDASYGAPQAPVLNLPKPDYGVPKPPSKGYGAPQAPPVTNYGVPQAPPISNHGAPVTPDTSYGVPKAPPVNDYGAPKVPVVTTVYGAPPAKKPATGYGVPQAPVVYTTAEPQSGYGSPHEPQSPSPYPPTPKPYGEPQSGYGYPDHFNVIHHDHGSSYHYDGPPVKSLGDHKPWYQPPPISPDLPLLPLAGGGQEVKGGGHPGIYGEEEKSQPPIVKGLSDYDYSKPYSNVIHFGSDFGSDITGHKTYEHVPNHHLKSIQVFHTVHTTKTPNMVKSIVPHIKTTTSPPPGYFGSTLHPGSGFNLPLTTPKPTYNSVSPDYVKKKKKPHHYSTLQPHYEGTAKPSYGKDYYSTATIKPIYSTPKPSYEQASGKPHIHVPHEDHVIHHHPTPKPAYDSKPIHNSTPKPVKTSYEEPHYHSSPKPSYEEKPLYHSSPKPAYEEKPHYHSTPKPAYEGKPHYHSSPKPSYDDKPHYHSSPKPSYEEEPHYHSSPKPSYDEKPRYHSTPKPSYDTEPFYQSTPKPLYHEEVEHHHLEPKPTYDQHPTPKPAYNPEPALYSTPEPPYDLKPGLKDPLKPYKVQEDPYSAPVPYHEKSPYEELPKEVIPHSSPKPSYEQASGRPVFHSTPRPIKETEGYQAKIEKEYYRHTTPKYPHTTQDNFKSSEPDPIYKAGYKKPKSIPQYASTTPRPPTPTTSVFPYHHWSTALPHSPKSHLGGSLYEVQASPKPLVPHGPPSLKPHYASPSPTPHYGSPTPKPHYGSPSLKPHYGTPTPKPHYGSPTPSPHYGPSPTPLPHLQIQHSTPKGSKSGHVKSLTPKPYHGHSTTFKPGYGTTAIPIHPMAYAYSTTIGYPASPSPGSYRIAYSASPSRKPSYVKGLDINNMHVPPLYIPTTPKPKLPMVTTPYPSFHQSPVGGHTISPPIYSKEHQDKLVKSLPVIGNYYGPPHVHQPKRSYATPTPEIPVHINHFPGVSPSSEDSFEKKKFYTSPRPVYVPSPVKGLSKGDFPDYHLKQGSSIAFKADYGNEPSKVRIEQLRKFLDSGEDTDETDGQINSGVISELLDTLTDGEDGEKSKIKISIPTRGPDTTTGVRFDIAAFQREPEKFSFGDNPAEAFGDLGIEPGLAEGMILIKDDNGHLKVKEGTLGNVEAAILNKFLNQINDQDQATSKEDKWVVQGDDDPIPFLEVKRTPTVAASTVSTVMTTASTTKKIQPRSTPRPSPSPSTTGESIYQLFKQVMEKKSKEEWEDETKHVKRQTQRPFFSHPTKPNAFKNAQVPVESTTIRISTYDSTTGNNILVGNNTEQTLKQLTKTLRGLTATVRGLNNTIMEATEMVQPKLEEPMELIDFMQEEIARLSETVDRLQHEKEANKGVSRGDIKQILYDVMKEAEKVDDLKSKLDEQGISTSVEDDYYADEGTHTLIPKQDIEQQIDVNWQLLREEEYKKRLEQKRQEEELFAEYQQLLALEEEIRKQREQEQHHQIIDLGNDSFQDQLQAHEEHQLVKQKLLESGGGFTPSQPMSHGGIYEALGHTAGGGLVQTDRQTAKKTPQIFDIPVTATIRPGPSRGPNSAVGAALQVVGDLAQENRDITVKLKDDQSGIVVGSSIPVGLPPSPSRKPGYQQSHPAFTTMKPLTHSFNPISASVSPAGIAVTGSPKPGSLWHPSPSPTIFSHLIEQDRQREIEKQKPRQPSTNPVRFPYGPSSPVPRVSSLNARADSEGTGPLYYNGSPVPPYKRFSASFYNAPSISAHSKPGVNVIADISPTPSGRHNLLKPGQKLDDEPGLDLILYPNGQLLGNQATTIGPRLESLLLSNYYRNQLPHYVLATKNGEGNRRQALLEADTEMFDPRYESDEEITDRFGTVPHSVFVESVSEKELASPGPSSNPFDIMQSVATNVADSVADGVVNVAAGVGKYLPKVIKTASDDFKMVKNAISMALS